MILTGEAAGKAAEIAESVRTDVERLCLKGVPDLKVTVSVGVTAARNAGRNGAKLVKLADSALYRAKNEGRNRVIQSE
jgi:diguanylate cyclase (GGDEF)-like protein